jgi:hypothetical protein
VYLCAARIDALLVCRGQVLRTSQPLGTRFGLGQVRRELGSGALRVVHVVFAPLDPRPLLLGIARLQNLGGEPLPLEYTETWEADGEAYRAAEGACERRTADGVRALAELSLVVRARAPEPPPRVGLALGLRLLLPPHSRRELCFAYAAPGPDDPPAALVRAYRGRVPAELVRGVRIWSERLASAARPIDAYRLQVGEPA